MPCKLFIGGIRSGKSSLAEKEALLLPPPRLYIATSVAIDEEMEKRIAKHQQCRVGLFETVEEPVNLGKIITESSNKYRVTLVDCLTFWYNNLFYYFDDEKKRILLLEELIDSLKKSETEIILVTNELGTSVIPDNPLARKFVDFSGWANQKICEVCEKTFFVVAGKKIPLE